MIEERDEAVKTNLLSHSLDLVIMEQASLHQPGIRVESFCAVNMVYRERFSTEANLSKTFGGYQIPIAQPLYRCQDVVEIKPCSFVYWLGQDLMRAGVSNG